MNTRNTLVRTLRNAALGTALVALLPVAAMAQDASLPERIKAAKALVVGIEATYPPMAYKDPKTNQRVGVNVDLVESIAKELGVSVKWEEMTFEQLMTSLTTGRIDMIGTAISDLPSRREKLTFVDYLVTGAQPFTTVAKKDAIKSEADLCGKTVVRRVPRTTSRSRRRGARRTASPPASLPQPSMARLGPRPRGSISSRAALMRRCLAPSTLPI
jgi:polar amino acid transport system substrate-binding protein